MAATPMDPLYEQRLRDEVIYLHSLWHQGPPRPAAPPAPHTHLHLQPSQATQFKRKNNKKRTKKLNITAAEASSSPGLEWAVPTPPPSPPANVWPTLVSKPNPKSGTLSAEDQSKSAVKYAHQHALKTVADFLRYNNADDDSDSTECISDEDDMDEDDLERDEYTFFFNVLKVDKELSDYYANNFAKGEFTCLVCGALGGKKMGKKFKGCLALVQHSITIAKTKKRRAHRAFGQAVCKVLGWDINELSTIVSLLSDKPGDTQESSIAFVDNVVSIESKNDEGVPQSGEGGDNSMTDDADKSSKDIGMVNDVEEHAATGLTNETGSVDNKESLLAIVDNVLTVEHDALKDRNDEAVPESGARISPNGDGDMSSLTRTDADKSLKDLAMVIVHEPATNGLTNISLTCQNADQSLENVDMMHPNHLEKPESEELTIVPLIENSFAGNEMQERKDELL